MDEAEPGLSSSQFLGARMAVGSSQDAPPRRRGWKVAAVVGACLGAAAVLNVASRGSSSSFLTGGTSTGLVARSGFASSVQAAWESPDEGTQVDGPSPTLFCWSHMEPRTLEVALLRLQLVKRASIFACNRAAVISSHKFLLGNIDGEDVYTWVNPSTKVKMGKNGVDGATTDSFLNTQIFLIAWDTLIGSGQLWAYDFVAKVDPDAVFFPDRLRTHVADHVGRPVYFTNCGKYGGEVLLYGSLEVFSSEALKRYEEHAEECKALDWRGWGEDYYMQQCLKMIGVENVPDTNQVGDDRCVAAGCSDYTRVAYHDFKEPQQWYDCFQEAVSR